MIRSVEIKSEVCFDDVGVFLENGNSENLDIKYKFTLISKNGKNITFSRSKQFEQDGRSWGCTRLITMKHLASNPDELLPGGCLQIQCEFKIFYSEKNNLNFITSDIETCQQSMKRLLSNSTLSDFEIVCDGETFSCHKSILAHKSDVLNKMLTSENWSENHKSNLTIEDSDPETVRSLLHFVYCCKLEDPAECSAR